jgi:hypothetical protein
VYGARIQTHGRACETRRMPTPLPRTARVLALALAAAVTVAACDSGSGSTATGAGNDSPLGKAAKATAAGSGTAHGTVDLTQGHSSYSVRWKGDFADGAGIVSGHLPGSATPAPLEVRWVGGQIYAHRTASADDYGQSPVGQLTAVRPDTAVWANIPADQAGARVFAPMSPADLLLALSASGTEKVSGGPAVGGVATRKVTVTDHIGLLFNWVGAKRAEVLLDGQDRVRRATVTFGKERVQLDVAYSKAAPTVTAPPKQDLLARTPPPPEPAGPFLTVRTGNDVGAAWTLQKAPGRDGGACWRWTSTPAMTVVKPNYQTDTRCVPPVAADADVTDQIDFVLWTDGSKVPQAAVVAAVPPGITQATLGFVGGRTEPAQVSNGLLTWVGPSDAPLGYVGFQDGATKIDCGIGAVSSPADLTNETLVGNPFGSAWLCQS